LAEARVHERGARTPGADTLRIAAAGAIAVVLVVVLAVDLLGGGSASDSGRGADRVVLSEYELLGRAETFDLPVYWFGPRPGAAAYELEADSKGDTYVRYLGEGDRDPRADSLTVGTYPVPEALASLERAASGVAGGEAISRQEGFSILGSSDSQSAYVVFEEQPELQVEVYSPRPGEAKRLAASGALTTLHRAPPP